MPVGAGVFCTMAGVILSHTVVDPIQVGHDTRVVPPASLAHAGTRALVVIVVAVFRAECVISMVTERISCNKDGTYLRIRTCSLGGERVLK